MTGHFVTQAKTTAFCLVAAAACFAAGYIFRKKTAKERWNDKINPETDKVVDTLTIKEAVDSGCMKANGFVSLCRCWKSEKWPYCDG